MSNSKVSSNAETMGSKNVDVSGRKRSGSAKTLQMPTVPEALPLLPDEAAWTIHSDLQNQPLAVTIEDVWPVHYSHVAMTTTVVYFWQNLEVHRREIVGPYDPNAVFPLVEYLPASVLSTGGIRQLRYQVSAPLLTTTSSFITMINVDKTEPNNNNPGPELIFGPEVADGIVTDDELVANNGIGAEVERWTDIRLEDEVEFFWGAVANVNFVGKLIIGPNHVAGAPILIHFPEDFIRKSGPGLRSASYRLIDRAGNIGPFSAPTEIEVSTIMLPDIPRAEVPLGEDDGLINLDDARTGVIVEIEQIFGAQPNDTLVIWWNTHTLAVVTIGVAHAWPIRVPVKWEILSAEGFEQAIPVRVRYLFQRGSASKPSPDSFYILDFSVAGPDPQGPDPINTQLPLVVVKGVTGDDVVTQADAPGPVRVEVRLWNGDVIPGQKLELFWGGEAALADEYEIQPGDLPGQTVVFWVPWLLIMRAASGQVPVYYWTDNAVNRQRSPDKLVRVELDTLKGLVRPVLLNDSDRNFVACDTHPEPWTGVFIGIPWNATHFEVGDRLEVYWSSHRTKDGSGDPFQYTSVTFHVELSDAHRDLQQVEVQIQPFNPLFTLPGLVAGWGSGVVLYRLFKASGPTGLSDKKLIYIDLKRPGGGTCLGPTQSE